jgi:hypothetical protein
MIWLVIAIIGSGTFIYSGISVLSDPFCQSVDFGGGRVIQITCRNDSFGAFSQSSAGWLSILGGLALLIFIFRRPILKALSGPNYTQVQRVDDTIFNRAFGEDSGQQNLDTHEMATTVDSQETKKCKFCAESVNIAAIKCKHCGSSLLPNFTEKIEEFLKSKNGKIISVGTLCFVLAISVFQINESNKAKELKQLNASGQVCVYSDVERTQEFGCSNYPNVEFGYCTTAKVLAPFWPDRNNESLLLEGANELGRWQGIVGGKPGDICSDPEYPNFFSYRWKTDFRVGTYQLLSVEYLDLESDTDVDYTGAGEFIVEISIKK